MKNELTNSQRDALAVLEQQKRDRQLKLQLVNAAYQESRLTVGCVWCGSESHSTDQCAANVA